MKKFISFAIVFIMVLAAVPFAGATVTEPSVPDIIIDGTGVTNAFTTTPKLTAGDYLNGNVGFKNISGGTITVKSVEMITDTDLSKFPFEVTQLNYYQVPQTTTVDRGGSFDFSISNLRCRGDAAQGYYDIPFVVIYTAGAQSTEYRQTLTMPVLIIEAGSTSSGSSSSVPIIIVTGFSTKPNEVVAGEDFELFVTFKNTSNSVTASNVKAQLTSDGTFNPVSGSSTLFTEALAPGASVSKSIKLHTKADAAPASYNVTFLFTYDYPNAKEPATSNEVVSIPVKQVPKVQVSKIQLSSTDVFLGQDVNVMANINNTGKATLYNVNVAFSDKSGVFCDNEIYLGNVLAGASGAVDVYLSTQATGEGTINMLVTYEDESGNSFSYTDSTSAFVNEKTVGPIDDPMYPAEPVKQGLSATWIVAIVIVLLIVGLIVFLSERKKKKAREQKKRDKQEAMRLDRELLLADEKNNEEIRL